MKTLVYTLALLAGVISLSAATPAEFTKGVDFTGQPAVTGSLLNQLVDAAKPAANRGLVIVTNGTPDTVNFPYLTNYLWKDTSTENPSLRFYVGGTWVSATIGPNSVVASSIMNGAVVYGKIATGAVQSVNLGTNVVLEYHVADLAVSEGKIRDDSISASKIKDNSVTTDKLVNSSVTTDKINNGAITGEKVFAATLTGDKIANNSIGVEHLKAGSVVQTNLAGNSVNQTNLMANSVTASNIVDGSVTADKLSPEVKLFAPVAWLVLMSNGSAIPDNTDLALSPGSSGGNTTVLANYGVEIFMFSSTNSSVFLVLSNALPDTKWTVELSNTFEYFNSATDSGLAGTFQLSSISEIAMSGIVKHDSSVECRFRRSSGQIHWVKVYKF